jgi:hypothetical protein
MLQHQHAHCSHGQEGFLPCGLWCWWGRGEAGRESRAGQGRAGQEVMYSSVPRIMSLNASESCDHKDLRRPLLPASSVRQQRGAQKLEEREGAAAAAAGRAGWLIRDRRQCKNDATLARSGGTDC